MTDIQNIDPFSLSLPEDWRAEPRNGSVIFKPKQIQRRHGLYSLTLAETAPDITPVDMRGDTSFHIRSAEGGSGGPEHFLTLWRAEGSKWLVLEAHQQTDPAPDFAEAWAIFESVSVK